MRYSYVNLVSCTAAAATGISFGVKNHGINSTKEINTIIFCRKFIRWRKISVGILRIEIHLVHKRNAVICRSFPWNWNEYDVNCSNSLWKCAAGCRLILTFYFESHTFDRRRQLRWMQDCSGLNVKPSTPPTLRSHLCMGTVKRIDATGHQRIRIQHAHASVIAIISPSRSCMACYEIRRS